MSPQQNTAKTIAATAAITLVIAGIALLFFRKIAKHRRRNKINSSFRREETTVTYEEFEKFKGRVKGLIVDENGQEVLYMRKLEDGELKATFPKVLFNPSYEEEDEEKRMDVTVQRTTKPRLLLNDPSDLSAHKKKEEPVLQDLTLPPPASAFLLTQPPPPTAAKKFPATVTAIAPPPPPPPPLQHPLPAPAPPPPVPVKTNPALAPAPSETVNLASPLKPPPAPRGNADKKREGAPAEESSKKTVVGQVRLKPLHWDKVVTNVDHSMVWNEIKDGSLRFDDEQIENLFGYTNTNRKLNERTKIPKSSGSSKMVPTAQIFILEPRKSQNTSIVLRSLTISRKEIIEALLDGQEVSSDTLEKLAKISPSEEDKAKILQFNGNPNKLADAESFLFHILKAVPSAFTRINAMLFRSSYESEILHFKESLQALEWGCKELRTRGLFLKLLEAILKAGNKMNAGTSRGNAQGFNLSALLKLSDVKSTDGKTTLLHFVVEQVMRSQGRRCAFNRTHSLARSSSQRSKNSYSISERLTEEERDNEYLKLGLPAVQSLSNEFSNVKKAAIIEYDALSNMCNSLTSHVAEIWQLVTRCANSEREGFLKEMKGFLEECEEELKLVSEEQITIMEFVKRTTEYYQEGVSNDKWASPLQLFVIVKEFLDMVDRVCADITQKLQQKKHVATSVTSSRPLSPPARRPVRFPNFRTQFMSDFLGTASSSESDDSF